MPLSRFLTRIAAAVQKNQGIFHGSCFGKVILDLLRPRVNDGKETPFHLVLPQQHARRNLKHCPLLLFLAVKGCSSSTISCIVHIRTNAVVNGFFKFRTIHNCIRNRLLINCFLSHKAFQSRWTSFGNIPIFLPDS